MNRKTLFTFPFTAVRKEREARIWVLVFGALLHSFYSAEELATILAAERSSNNLAAGDLAQFGCDAFDTPPDVGRPTVGTLSLIHI